MVPRLIAHCTRGVSPPQRTHSLSHGHPQEETWECIYVCCCLLSVSVTHTQKRAEQAQMCPVQVDRSPSRLPGVTSRPWDRPKPAEPLVPAFPSEAAT